MIVFFQKSDGKIVGCLEGRIHDKDHLKIHIGSIDEIEKLVIQWKPVKFYNKDGKEIDPKKEKIFTADFEPEHEQKDLFTLLDQSSSKVYDYRVDLKTKTLVLK
jgi:hypothetical protein